MDNVTVYFAAAIRGKQISNNIVVELINFIKELGFAVLTEHILTNNQVNVSINQIGKIKEGLIAKGIEPRDIAWLDRSTHVIAEISGASTGVGREIEYARTKGHFGKIPAKILCLYEKERELFASPMIIQMTPSHYPNVFVRSYSKINQAKIIVQEFLKN